MEIPVLFPTLNEGVARYRVVEVEANKSKNPTVLSLTPVDHRHHLVQDAASLSSTPAHWTASPSLQGAASVTRFTNDALITTLLLEEEPWVLSVSVLKASSSSSATSSAKNPYSSSTIELDLSTCTGFQGIARVRAFPHSIRHSPSTAAPNAVRLVLVDRNGIILQIVLDWDVDEDANALQPRTVTMHRWTSRNILPVSAVHPNSLNASRVGFFNDGRVLLALTPFLFTINVLKNDDMEVWHRGTCLDLMKRQSSFSFFGLSSPGKSHHDGTFVDMNPVTALTVAEDESTSVVWTLHSDGVLRCWMLDRASHSAPTSLYESRPRHLPSPDRWGGEDEHGGGAPQLVSRLYHNNGQVSSCAVSVPHVDGCCLSVVHGSVGTTTSTSGSSKDGNSNLEGEVSLQVPQDALSLISMDFDIQSEKCSLWAWFHQVQGTEDARGTVCVQYRPSHVSILDAHPTVLPTNDLLDRMVWKERQHIERMEPIDSTYELPLKEALHQVDQQFLRFLVRPMIRGITPMTAPSPTHIRNALSKWVRSPTTVVELGTRCIEVEVVLAVHERREDDLRQRHAWTSSPMQMPRKHGGIGLATPATPASVRTDYAQATPGGMSIYDMIGWQQESDHDDDAMNDPSDIPIEHDDNEKRGSTLPNQNVPDTQEEIDHHVARWRQLLLMIWEEEYALCVPLVMSSSTVFSADVGILVRSGAISVLVKASPVPPSQSDSRTPVLAFDNSASELIAFLELDESLVLLLEKIGREHLGMVSSVDLAFADHGEQKRFTTLDHLIEEVRASGYQSMDNSWLQELSTSLEDDVVAALEDVTVPVPRIDGDSRTNINSSNSSVTGTFQLGRQQRLSICGVVVRNLESVQRLLLGRCLLLRMELPLLSRTFEACIRMYSHVTAVRWVAAQRVPVTLTRERPIIPPKKRPSLDGSSPSILDSPDSTSVLDAYLLHLRSSGEYLKLIPDHRLSMASSALAVSADVISTCLRFLPEPKHDTYWEPPELGILAPDPFLHPKLQLLLLAPHVAFPRASDEPYVVAERVLKMAVALLTCAQSEPVSRAREMVARAFDLLPFDPSDENKSSRHFDRLRHQVSKSGDGAVINMFMDYIENAISMMDHSMDESQVTSKPLYGLLWTNLFCHSISAQVQNWEKAFYACLKNPDTSFRITNLQSLARAMVSNGSLSELVKLCKSNGGDGTELGFQEFMTDINMYDIASDALSEKPDGVSYADRLCGSEGSTGRQEALYALHASKNEWNRAAQAMDTMYTNAIAALRAVPSDDELGADDARRRERFIINDLLVSSFACFAATASVDDSASQYLTSEDPTRLADSRFENATGKRHRESGVIRNETAEHDRDKSRIMRCLSLDDLETRSAFVDAFSTLYEDDRAEPNALRCSFLECQSPSIGDKMKTSDYLFVHGHFEQGLVTAKLLVATDTPGSLLGGQTVFHETLVDLLCTYLVPLSLGATTEFIAPLPMQLNHALDALSICQSSLPPALSTRRSKKQPQLPECYVEACAMVLLQNLTSSYSSARMPLVTQVAESYLSLKTQLGRLTPLPAWLESLLMRGSTPVESFRPGIFARPGHPQHEGYPGDPSALLSMYIRVGLYQDACRVVMTLLSDDRDEVNAPRRLPEKGETDFVAYDKIDLLWNLIDIELEGGSGRSKSGQKKLQEARQGMENALEHHFRLLKISEMGLQSARALSAQQ